MKSTAFVHPYNQVIFKNWRWETQLDLGDLGFHEGVILLKVKSLHYENQDYELISLKVVDQRDGSLLDLTHLLDDRAKARLCNEAHQYYLDECVKAAPEPRLPWEE